MRQMPDAPFSQFDRTAADGLLMGQLPTLACQRTTGLAVTPPLVASSNHPAVRQLLRGGTPYLSH